VSACTRCGGTGRVGIDWCIACAPVAVRARVAALAYDGAQNAAQRAEVAAWFDARSTGAALAQADPARRPALARETIDYTPVSADGSPRDDRALPPAALWRVLELEMVGTTRDLGTPPAVPDAVLVVDGPTSVLPRSPVDNVSWLSQERARQLSPADFNRLYNNTPAPATPAEILADLRALDASGAERPSVSAPRSFVLGDPASAAAFFGPGGPLAEALARADAARRAAKHPHCCPGRAATLSPNPERAYRQRGAADLENGVYRALDTYYPMGARRHRARLAAMRDEPWPVLPPWRAGEATAPDRGQHATRAAWRAAQVASVAAEREREGRARPRRSGLAPFRVALG
jgi:hypothetical protein